MKIIEKDISEIRPYENNPRKNISAIDGVAESIKNFGFRVPIVIDTNDVIVCGHTRYLAAIQLGMTALPCVVADDLTPQQIKAFRIADNSTASLASWNEKLLKEELVELQEFNWNLLGLDVKVSDGQIYEDDPPAVDYENAPITKLGDVWKLGQHILCCGDCTDNSLINFLMNKTNGCDLVVTDPPYNMNYEGGGGTSKAKRQMHKIQNDNMPVAEFDAFICTVYSAINMLMKDGASFYVFFKELGQGVFLTNLEKAGLSYNQILCWVKNQIVIGGARYQNMYEPCIFGHKGKRIKQWYGKRKQRSVIEDIDLLDEKGLREYVKELLAIDEADIIREPKPTVADLHPTMKPIRLLSRFILNSSAPNDLVFDPFGGSGSTLIACEQTHRRCLTIELEPRFCDVIIQRWQNLTGQEAELEGYSWVERLAQGESLHYQ